MCIRDSGTVVVGQLAFGRFHGPGLGIAVAVEDHGHMLPEQPGQQLPQGRVQLLSLIHI